MRQQWFLAQQVCAAHQRYPAQIAFGGAPIFCLVPSRLLAPLWCAGTASSARTRRRRAKRSKGVSPPASWCQSASCERESQCHDRKEWTSFILTRVREFSEFGEDNDPHGEHDFGSFDVKGAVCDDKLRQIDDLSNAPKVSGRSFAPRSSSQVARVKAREAYHCYRAL